MGNSVHNWASQKRSSFSLNFAKARKHPCVTRIPLGHTVTVSTKQHRAFTYSTAGTQVNWNQETIHFISAILQVWHCYQCPRSQNTLVQCWQQSRITSMWAWALTGLQEPPKWWERHLPWIPLNLLRSPKFLPRCPSALNPRAGDMETTLQEPPWPNKSSRACLPSSSPAGTHSSESPSRSMLATYAGSLWCVTVCSTSSSSFFMREDSACRANS